MPANLRIALTADLHWGSHADGDEATRDLLAFLYADPPDVLVLGGDVGTSSHFGECLGLFANLPGRKAAIPGNHDIWVTEDDPRGDSLAVYRDYLPRVCAEHGFHYLDQGPLLLPEADLALAGSINWYDYSWSIDALRRQVPDWQARLKTKVFSRGRHNDARFVRWPLDDVRFTVEVVETLERLLRQALAGAGRIIVVAHHPPFYGLSFPREAPPTSLDELLWDAFAGNRAMEEVLSRHANHIPFAFCGHTHRARENQLGKIRGYNIGGDYHFKRLLVLDWPRGAVEGHTFGDPGSGT
ncbi:MAG TPA: metallophosphoesterase [Gemmataceae bacterium]|jgi:3',5'-cyclic AMP phosphodiesterase CpdA|nr:metallophosphoesterase [Gemmataceae bacterium]